MIIFWSVQRCLAILMANEVMQNHQLLSPFSSEFCVSLREDVIKLSPWQNFFITYTGYRLAFNYLKAKRLVDAIDVCHKVYTSLISFCIDVSQLLFPLSDNGWYISTTDSRVMSHTSQGQLSCPWKWVQLTRGEKYSHLKRTKCSCGQKVHSESLSGTF